MLTYAQNFEDVMLARLFQAQSKGFYVDIGAWHPTELSVTKHFYDLGWSGINIEPIKKQYELFAAERPRDLNLCVAVTDRKGSLRFHECAGDTSLSTTDDAQAVALVQDGHTITSYDVGTITPAEILAYCEGKTVDFLKIDAEGCEERIVRSVDWQLFRPRALVIEATSRLRKPFIDWDYIEALRNWDAWEPLLLAAGYVLACYDGLNRFYVRDEDAHLARRLAIPPGVYDQLQFPIVERFARGNAEIRYDREHRDNEIQKFVAIMGIERRANESTIEELRRDLENKKDIIGELISVLGTVARPMGQTGDEILASLAAKHGKLDIRRARQVIALMKRTIRAIIGYRLGQFFMYAPRAVSLPSRYGRPQGATGALRISIVTPVYNQARFIGTTIESVLHQNYRSLEYIVMDGGSVDGSTEIIERYRSSLAKFETGADAGQANAINKGMAHASGDVLAWLNGDDLLLPGAIEYVAHFFEQHPEVDVVYGHRIVIDTDGRKVGHWILPPHDDDILSWADFVPQETLFWRRRIWERVGTRVDESFQFAMDWDLLLRFRDAGARFCRIPRFLGAFRVHRGQKTSKDLETIGAAEMSRIRLRCLGYLPSYPDISRNIAPYLLKHVLLHNINNLYKLY